MRAVGGFESMTRRADEGGQWEDRAEIATDGAGHRATAWFGAERGPDGGYAGAVEAAIERVVRACRKRLRKWRVPRNWSPADWLDELAEVAWVAGWEAYWDFDPSKGVRLAWFVWARAMQSALTRHRQEWRYIGPLVSEVAEETLDAAEAGNAPENGPLSGKNGLPQSDLAPVRVALRDAVADLPQGERWLVQQLFWEGRTEAEVARILGISQRAVSRRKKAVMLALRAAL